MTIDQKALGEATDAILMRVPFGYGMTKPEAGRYAEAAITTYLDALPAPDHAGMVEKLRLYEKGDFTCPAELISEAATALSAGVRVGAAAKRLLDHWDENSGPEKRGEFEGVEYWSPAGRVVDTQFIADLRSALSDAPVVTEEMVERAAKGIYAEGPSIGQDYECGWEDQTPQYKEKARMIARAALTAALGGGK